LIGEDVNGGQVSLTLPQTCGALEDVVFKVSDRWLAWGCNGAGSTVYRGVVNLDTGVNKPINAEGDPALGDGFLVNAAMGSTPDGLPLELIDFTKTPAVTTPLPTLDWGVGTQLGGEGVRWAVDRSGGQTMAWTEGTGRIHVVPLGVPASPLRIGSATVPTVFTPNRDGLDDLWHPIWEVSKPVKWTLTLRRNGLAMRILAGDSHGAAVTPEWDGLLRGWARWINPVPNGVYTYTLTMTPADGIGAAFTVSGSVQVANAIVIPLPPVTPRRG
jgi:hypothetical protein